MGSATHAGQTFAQMMERAHPSAYEAMQAQQQDRKPRPAPIPSPALGQLSSTSREMDGYFSEDMNNGALSDSNIPSKAGLDVDEAPLMLKVSTALSRPSRLYLSRLTADLTMLTPSPCLPCRDAQPSSSSLLSPNLKATYPGQAAAPGRLMAAMRSPSRRLQSWATTSFRQPRMPPFQ